MAVDKWTNLARLLKNKNEYAGTLFFSVHLTTKENLQHQNIMYQVNNLKISVDTRWTLGGHSVCKIGVWWTQIKKIQKTLVFERIMYFCEKLSYVQEVSNI